MFTLCTASSANAGSLPSAVNRYVNGGNIVGEGVGVWVGVVVGVGVCVNVLAGVAV